MLQELNFALNIKVVFELDFSFEMWSFDVPDKFALSLSSFLVVIDFINEFLFQQFFRFGVPYILGRFIPTDERRLIALYHSLDQDNDKNLSKEELKKGMERLQKVSRAEAASHKKGTADAAAALKMARAMDVLYESLVEKDKADTSTIQSSGFTLHTLLKEYRRSKRAKQKQTKVVPEGEKAAYSRRTSFANLQDALESIDHHEMEFIIDNTADGRDATGGGLGSRHKMGLGITIEGLKVTSVAKDGQAWASGVPVT